MYLPFYPWLILRLSLRVDKESVKNYNLDMSKPLTIEDIDDSVSSRVYTQDYSKKQTLEGVRIIELKNHVAEDGDFSELLRFSESGVVEGVLGFKIAQINRSRMLPHAVKAWHLHLIQDEMWYVVPSQRLTVGLWDIRKTSSTKGKSIKIVLGGGLSQLLYIPRGIAHGCVNYNDCENDLFYFVSEVFNVQNPDEKRLAWDALGATFWNPPNE